MLGVFLVGISVGFLAGVVVQHNLTLIECRAKAIEHGAAKYVCDDKTGAVEFRWKEGK